MDFLYLFLVFCGCCVGLLLGICYDVKVVINTPVSYTYFS